LYSIYHPNGFVNTFFEFFQNFFSKFRFKKANGQIKLLYHISDQPNGKNHPYPIFLRGCLYQSRNRLSLSQRLLFSSERNDATERKQVAKAVSTGESKEVVKKPVVNEEAKIGRNDPCPCGSGKKYKQCCGNK
jgi:preprotein translocase subunit SecA